MPFLLWLYNGSAINPTPTSTLSFLKTRILIDVFRFSGNILGCWLSIIVDIEAMIAKISYVFS